MDNSNFTFGGREWMTVDDGMSARPIGARYGGIWVDGYWRREGKWNIVDYNAFETEGEAGVLVVSGPYDSMEVAMTAYMVLYG